MSTDSAHVQSEPTDSKNKPTPTSTPDGLPFAISLILGIGGLIILVCMAMFAENIMTTIVGEERIEKIKEGRRLAKKGIDTIPSNIVVPISPSEDLPVREGLQTWLRAEDAFVSEKGSVTYVPDASGNENHAIQTRRRWQPTLKENVLNGKPVLRFDGTDDFMKVGSFGDSTFVTVICVWIKPKEGGDPYQRVYSSGSQGLDYQAKGIYYIPKTDNNGVGSSPVQITMKRPRKTKDASNFVIARLNVKSDPPQHFFGQIAEMIVYNRRVTNDERDELKAYLTSKYGI